MAFRRAFGYMIPRLTWMKNERNMLWTGWIIEIVYILLYLINSNLYHYPKKKKNCNNEKSQRIQTNKIWNLDVPKEIFFSQREWIIKLF